MGRRGSSLMESSLIRGWVRTRTPSTAVIAVVPRSSVSGMRHSAGRALAVVTGDRVGTSVGEGVGAEMPTGEGVGEGATANEADDVPQPAARRTPLKNPIADLRFQRNDALSAVVVEPYDAQVSLMLRPISRS